MKKVVCLILLLNLFFADISALGMEESFAGQNELSALIEKAKDICRDPALRHGQWSFFVMEAASGQTHVEINGDKSLVPASNLKLLTTAAALAYLGPDYRFSTELGYTGFLKEGVLSGDLIVVGGGDPTLGSQQVTGSRDMEAVVLEWARAVRRAGINRINGSVIADISYFDPISISDGWPWVDIGNYYGAGPSALCFNDNLYYLYLKPAKKTGGQAEVLYTKPEVKGLTFDNYMTTGPAGSGDQGYVYGGPGEMRRILRGTIPAGIDYLAIKGSLPDPAFFCGQVLRDRLQKEGIKVEKGVMDSMKSIVLSEKLLTIKSPPLRDIVFWINKRSINLYAEVLFKQIGLKNNGDSRFENGIKALKGFLHKRQISVEGMHLADGSGLSPLNAITTRQMVLLLRSMAKDRNFVYFYNSLPVAGLSSDEGGLGHLCQGSAAAGNLRAKTGTLKRVRAHAGYVNTKTGRLLCFCIIANDFLGDLNNIDRLHEILMTQLALLE